MEVPKVVIYVTSKNRLNEMQLNQKPSRTDEHINAGDNVYSLEEVRYAKAISEISLKMNGFPLSLEDVYFERERENQI
jgi:hypothetical protein